MIDRNRIAELRDEVGEEDFRDVLGIFFEEVGETLDALHAGHGEDTLRNLHFLKGSALNIGMIEVSRLCGEGESILREAPSATIDVNAIKSAYETAKSELSAL